MQIVLIYFGLIAGLGFPCPNLSMSFLIKSEHEGFWILCAANEVLEVVSVYRIGLAGSIIGNINGVELRSRGATARGSS